MGQVQSTMTNNVERRHGAVSQACSLDMHRSTTLYNLANLLRVGFQQCGVLSDLNKAIELYQTALMICPPDHSEVRYSSLKNLAVSLRDRFEQQGVLSDLDEAIKHSRAALALCPHRFTSFNTLAGCLVGKFGQWGVLSDLDEAIEHYRAALALCPLGHPHRSEFLNNLASSLIYRFRQQGVLSDLSEAIELFRAALVLHPPGHLHRSISLNNLASSLQCRFLQQGILSDLDEGIELHRAALLLRPPGHPERFKSFCDLGCALRARFKQRGVLSDLDEAIDLSRAALVIYPPGHSGKSIPLSNLAVCLRDRFEQRGILSDLDESLELHRAALVLNSSDHLSRSTSLNNLAASLQSRFRQQGILSDLDEAIVHYRAALVLCPPGHPEQLASLSNLATGLQIRFTKRGVQSDQDEAIELHRAVPALLPLDHPNRSASLSNLALSLQSRFKLRGVPSDLDEAIERVLCLVFESEERDVPSDLNEAIELHRAALMLRPPGHSDRSGSLINLAISLHIRFTQWGVLSDVDEAIEHYQAALMLRPPGHSERSMSLNSLAASLLDRSKWHGLSSDLDTAFGIYLQLSEVSHAASRNDLYAVKSWAASAEQLEHDSALLAYQTALRFLDKLVAVLSSSSHHFDAVREATSSLAMDAFSCSVRHGALTTAVELVEQGRAVFWTQLARFRTPLDELSASSDTGKALAEEFKRLSFRLRDAFEDSTQDRTSQIREVTAQWNDVVSRIRMRPDFSRFLLPPLFSDLQKAAEEGPVIIVNASQYSCDALIILSAQDPVHVPLDIARADVSELSSEFQSLAEGVGSSDHQLGLQKFVSVLRKLWLHIVGPVVQALKESNVNRGSRIWWCPTAEFTLLPLHAAGPYERKRSNLSHIYISSYTPTLATLIRARRQVSRDVQHFVAIGQANPDIGGKELRCVAPELAVVAQHIAPVMSFTSLADSHATVQGALDVLSQNQWLHLACHGMPNRQQPFESSFAMRDGPLMIKDIVRSDWQSPEFAFLSACHTTVGDEKSPDESIHLAAAMQFSGFRSVIGSMWSVDDEVARQMASAFYSNLVDSSGRLDCTRAAVALHKAVKTLRKKVPLEQQIVFVHIGV
ncbi:CHAT domain-containing protein [Suillus paluster]|uniref:CHAT domain-containing protein n=1 Tax=Suillus paluster TaxID=48578 RepID=UPI001B862C72|nr:CHAT domain-containing protein [Suillus paluster]KAG1734893.1 CHAT domain-containing protein [Suillus paluster]